MSYYVFLDEYILNLTVGGLHNFHSLSIFDIYSWIPCLVLDNFKRNIYFLQSGKLSFFGCPSIWVIFLNNKCILIQGKTKNCVQYAVHAKIVRYGQTPWVGEIVKQTCQQWPKKASRLNDKRWTGIKADPKV